MQLATPVIIGQVAVFSMNFVDTVMAGRLPDKEIALGFSYGNRMEFTFLFMTLSRIIDLLYNYIATNFGIQQPCSEGGRF